MLGPRLVHGALPFWMQTTGATLLAVKKPTIVRMWVPAQDGRSALGLLYSTAVWDDSCQQERRQVSVDIAYQQLLTRCGQLVQER